MIPIAVYILVHGRFLLILAIYTISNIEGTWPTVAWNIGLVAACSRFYWFRYGGTLSHDDKPEWDTIPTVVKKIYSLLSATVPDLCALETVFKHPLRDEYTASPEDIDDAIYRIVSNEYKDSWQDLNTPLHAFKRVASGLVLINRNIYSLLLVKVSHNGLLMNLIRISIYVLVYGILGIIPHMAQVPNFLPAGNVSRPSIVSLLSGVYDAGMEINEREAFWHDHYRLLWQLK